MIMKCSQCGAPLDVSEGSTYARCQYCGVNVRLVAPEPQRVAPPQPQPDAGQRGLMVALASMGLMLIMGIAGALVLSTEDTQQLPPPPLPPPAVPSAPAAAATPGPALPSHFSGPVCQLDANGDGVWDLLGLSNVRGSSQPQPTVIDGASGAVIFRAEPRQQAPQLACLDSRWFVVVAPNFQAEFYDARNLGAPVRVLLRDRLSAHAMGQGCVRLRTDDRSVTGIALPGGNVVACETKAKFNDMREGGPGTIGLTEKRTELEHEGRTYELEKRSQGSHVLTVRVREGKKQLWSRELPYVAPTFNTGIATNGRSIAVWGAEPGNTSDGILVGLDAQTGEQRYAVPANLTISHSFRHFAYNGRFIVVQVLNSLRAHEPETGAIAWRIGD